VPVYKINPGKQLFISYFYLSFFSLMPLKSFLKDYFSFSTRERNAIIILIIIILIQLCAMVYLRWLPQIQDGEVDEKFLREAEEFERQVKQIAENEKIEKFKSSRKTQSVASQELFSFNPNNLADSLWMKLLNDSMLVRRIKNYERKGGRFRIKADVKKMYGLDSVLYEQLRSFIQLPDSINQKKKQYFSTDSRKERKVALTEKIDLNNARMADLKSVKGIGEIRANRILLLRNRLGGFYSVEQLKEVNGLDEEAFMLIEKQVTVSLPVFRKINLSNSECSIGLHPYLNQKLCREVNKRRILLKKLESEDMQSIPEMTDSLWKRLSPYLEFE